MFGIIRTHHLQNTTLLYVVPGLSWILGNYLSYTKCSQNFHSNFGSLFKSSLGIFEYINFHSFIQLGTIIGWNTLHILNYIHFLALNQNRNINDNEPSSFVCSTIVSISKRSFHTSVSQLRLLIIPFWALHENIWRQLAIFHHLTFAI